MDGGQRNDPIYGVLRELCFLVLFLVWPLRAVRGLISAGVLEFRSYDEPIRRDLLSIAVIGVIAVLIWTGWSVTDWAVLTFEFWNAGNGTTTRSEILRNIGLLSVALVGLIFAIWRTRIAHTATYLTEQGQITDRFAEAVKMLSAPDARSRIGGIYALSRIAQDSPKRDFVPVLDTLCEFVRNPPYLVEQIKALDTFAKLLVDDKEKALARSRIPCPDIQVAITVINERTRDLASPQYIADFGGAVWVCLDLKGVNLAGYSLVDIDATGANLDDAELSDAIMIGAKFIGTSFSGAVLEKSYAPFSDFSDAIFEFADIQGATMGMSKNLTQNQVNSVLPTAPARTLPTDLEWPFENIDGAWMPKSC